MSRSRYYASVAVLAGACIACILAGFIELGTRAATLGIYPAESAEQAGFAIELFMIGGLNLLALVAFLLRRSGWGWFVALGVQVGVLVLAMIEGLLTDLGWFFFSSVPLLTLLLLLAIGKVDGRRTPFVKDHVTPFSTR